MGNYCNSENLTADYQYLSKFKNLSITDRSELAPLDQNIIQKLTTQRKHGTPHCPIPVEGQFVSMPQLKPQVCAHLPEDMSLRQASQLSGKQFYGPFKFFDTGIIYVGEWQVTLSKIKNHKPHGRGRCYFEDGSVYDGAVEYGMPNGSGKYIMKNGEFYEGQVKMGMAHGKGTYVSEGSKFEGNYENDHRDGWGQQTTKNYKFQGYFKQGARYLGKLQWQSCTYNGDFVNDLFEGKGILSSEEGTYNGQFQKGKKHGKGTFRWKDGTEYIGFYDQDKRTGSGTYYDSKGKIIKSTSGA